MPPEGKEKEEELSEAAERSFEVNFKILLGNEISHAKRMDILAENAIAQNNEFARKANDAYLERCRQMADSYANAADARLEETNDFVTSLHKNFIENNRYTLDRLYSIFPEEAVGLGTLLSAFQEYLKSQGWTAPSSS
jgi:hypothetical protein